MITTFSYNSKDYTINIKNENIGSASAFQDPDWLVTAVDSRNAQYANIRIKNSVVAYMSGKTGETPEVFLTGVAQNEIKLNVDYSLNSGI